MDKNTFLIALANDKERKINSIVNLWNMRLNHLNKRTKHKLVMLKEILLKLFEKQNGKKDKDVSVHFLLV